MKRRAQHRSSIRAARGAEAQISQAATLARPPASRRSSPPQLAAKFCRLTAATPKRFLHVLQRINDAVRALTIHITYLNPPVEQNVLHVFIYLNYAGAVAARHHCDKYSSSDSAE